MAIKNLPEYAHLISKKNPTKRHSKDNTTTVAIQLSGEDEYHRAAGAWWVKVKRVRGKLISISEQPTINNCEIVGTTKAQWKKDNKGYIT